MAEAGVIDALDALQHHFAGGVYAKGYTIPAGHRLVQHRHAEAHLSILAAGRAVLLVDGEKSELTGPVCITIEAEKHHGVKALTDCVWYCLHADEPDHDQVVEPDNEEMGRMLDELL
jgi:quercetin dioxygenase-like cupin family protein